MSHFTREIFQKSVDYLYLNYKLINDTVLQSLGRDSGDFKECSIEEIVKIRNDYNLEEKFYKNFDYLQFLFKMKYENSVFSYQPTFDDWWKIIESMTRDKILSKISKFF